MWRTPWPWSTAVLTVALILVARRLSNVQVELERARALSHADGAISGGDGRSVDGRHVPVLRETSDMSAEWEQALLPMDS